MSDPYYHEIPWRRVGGGLLPLWRGLVRARRWLAAPVTKPPERYMMIYFWCCWLYTAIGVVARWLRDVWP